MVQPDEPHIMRSPTTRLITIAPQRDYEIISKSYVIFVVLVTCRIIDFDSDNRNPCTLVQKENLKKRIKVSARYAMNRAQLPNVHTVGARSCTSKRTIFV